MPSTVDSAFMGYDRVYFKLTQGALVLRDMPVDVVGVFGFLTRELFKEDMPMCHKSQRKCLVNSQRAFFSWGIKPNLKYSATLTRRKYFSIVFLFLLDN